MAYNQMTIDIMETIKKIPPGFVSSYGVIARVAGYGNGARQVVRVLSALSEKEKLPWHRVVNKQGKIVLAEEGECEQIFLLELEGVTFIKEGVVHPRHFYQFDGGGLYD